MNAKSIKIPPIPEIPEKAKYAAAGAAGALVLAMFTPAAVLLGLGCAVAGVYLYQKHALSAEHDAEKKPDEPASHAPDNNTENGQNAGAENTGL